jgi:hypothetical protein
MTLIRSFLTVVSFALVFASCKKDDSVQGPPQGDRIKTYTESINSSIIGVSTVTYNLTYDDQGRLSSMVNSENAGDRFAFSYVENGFDMDIYSSNSLIIHQDVFLNGNRMDSTFQYNDEGDTTTEKYLYNPGNLLVKLSRYVYSDGISELDETVNYTYDSNNNLVSEIGNYTHVEYEYNGNLPAIINLFPLFYSSSQKLPSRVIDQSGFSATHTYTLDSKNRLVTDLAVLDSGDTITKTYTYE